MLCIIFSGCSKTEHLSTQYDQIAYKEGVYYYKNWDETIGTYTKDAIPSKQAAIEVASAIFKEIQINESYKNYTAQSVFFDVDDNIWIVSFWDNKYTSHAGSSYSIAIRMKDAKIMRIWFGE